MKGFSNIDNRLVPKLGKEYSNKTTEATEEDIDIYVLEE